MKVRGWAVESSARRRRRGNAASIITSMEGNWLTSVEVEKGTQRGSWPEQAASSCVTSLSGDHQIRWHGCWPSWRCPLLVPWRCQLQCPEERPDQELPRQATRLTGQGTPRIIKARLPILAWRARTPARLFSSSCTWIYTRWIWIRCN